MASIGGITIPSMGTNMDDRGSWQFWWPEQVGETGEGLPIYAGYARAEWRYDFLYPNEWDWWTLTLLENDRHKLFNAANLWTDNLALTIYTRLIVHRPEAGPPIHNEYRDVLINITGINI